MTVTYSAEVATCRGFGCFLKLLARWRGSIYKLVWMDLIAFLFLYYLLSFTYRYALNPDQQRIFESLVHYCNSYGSVIPLSFVLGFYVSIVMQRWWDQYLSIPWPDPVAVFVSAHVHGPDERGRVMRRTVMRYVCLCLTMVLISMAPRVKKRFPKLDNLVDAGLLQESEKEVIESFNQKFPKHPKHWMPIVWAASIISRARKEGRIRDDFSMKTIIDELNRFRGMCGVLMHYDTISIPLVYTQVVTLAVYSYFLSNIMGKQWTSKPDEAGYYNLIDNYFPVFTTLEFFFYMGWLKVAESLINPFGDDDDDFEINWLIDRNLQVSYLIVDEMHHEHPELIRDQYWDEVLPNELPYAEADGKRDEPPEASTARIDVTKSALPNFLSAFRIDAQDSTAQLNGKMNRDSTQSLGSIRGSRSRFNVMMMRLLGREDTRATDPIVTTSSSSLSDSDSQAAASASAKDQRAMIRKPSGTVRIVEDVILEMDEEKTLTNQPSGLRESTSRLDVREVFGQEPQPAAEQDEQNNEGEDGIKFLRAISSFTSEDTASSKDDFDRLREEREKERLERQKAKYARSVGTAANMAGDLQTELTAQTSTIIPLIAIVPTITTSTPRTSREDNVSSDDATEVGSRSSLSEAEKSDEERKRREEKRNQGE